MKKLFLVAILLGLTGCGDNNQSDTSQSDTTQTTQLQTTELAVPTTSNYKLAASSLMMSPAISPLGGWSITKSTTMGASTLVDAVNDTRVSAALITPNAKQVAEVLRGGVAGVALAIAVDQLLDAVDWVLDPANNSIKYKEQLPNYPTVPWMWATGAGQQSDYIYPTAEAAGRAICSYYGEGYKEIYWYSHPVNAPVAYVWCVTSDGYRDLWDIRGRANPAYNPNVKLEEKYLPLEAVAEKVISNADTGSLDAQVATNAATQNILNDAVQAEPVVQELENNANNNCPSGLTNKKGDCWVCSRDSYTPIRSRVVYAKDVVGGLGECKISMNSGQLLTRRNAYSELGNARDAENSCWSPQDSNHLKEALEAKRIAAECNTYLGVLGQ